ncbi:outer membrane protein [Yoonia vestfoldensis]|uniref:outer membrane protein n=1 Tax=Yoonia vestfoldensis TaxID=245188 RepID=UPI000373563E|nr:outer membrane beta-barrel protein [Yoonia vestfoldensis]
MKKMITSCAIATLGFNAFPAFAGGLAEPVMEQAPVVPATPLPVRSASGWDGLYVGGQVGNVTIETSIRIGDVSPLSDTPNELADYDIDGSGYGLHIGYMHGVGRLVLGGEVDYDVITLDEGTSTFDGTTATIPVDTDGSILRLKARAGYDAGRLLPYATAGLARLELESEDTDGTFFGAGIAFKATESILVGGEILRHQFDDSFDTSVDIDATTMSLRASYRF